MRETKKEYEEEMINNLLDPTKEISQSQLEKAVSAMMNSHYEPRQKTQRSKQSKTWTRRSQTPVRRRSSDNSENKQPKKVGNTSSRKERRDETIVRDKSPSVRDTIKNFQQNKRPIRSTKNKAESNASLHNQLISASSTTSSNTQSTDSSSRLISTEGPPSPTNFVEPTDACNATVHSGMFMHGRCSLLPMEELSVVRDYDDLPTPGTSTNLIASWREREAVHGAPYNRVYAIPTLPVKSQESDMSIESLPFQNRVVEYDEMCESRSAESSVSFNFHPMTARKNAAQALHAISEQIDENGELLAGSLSHQIEQQIEYSMVEMEARLERKLMARMDRMEEKVLTRLEQLVSRKCE